MNLVAGQEKNVDIENGLDTGWEAGQSESSIDIYTLLNVK